MHNLDSQQQNFNCIYSELCILCISFSEFPSEVIPKFSTHIPYINTFPLHMYKVSWEHDQIIEAKVVSQIKKQKQAI